MLFPGVAVGAGVVRGDQVLPGISLPEDAERRADSGTSVLVQVGWMNPKTGVMCDCPSYERSPHAKSVPVWKEVG